MNEEESGAEKRILRPRSKVNYKEEEVDTRNMPHVPYAKLAEKICQGRFEASNISCDPREVNIATFKANGFQSPVCIRPLDGIERTRQELGIQIPQNLSIEDIAEAVGCETRLHTINVSTQRPGPRMTMGAWMEYFKLSVDARKSLLNVVSLPLAGTNLEARIKPPLVVRQLDLVNQVWPLDIGYKEQNRPEVLLYALMSPQGSFTDFHIDFGGSSVWYHMISGSKTFLLVPPTPTNMKKYELWASSEKQASIFYAEELEGCVRYDIKAGDTLLIPSGWPHGVVTLSDSFVIGGNFLHSLDLKSQVEVHAMEERLGVEQKSRFPLYRQLMWHTANYFHRKLASEDKGLSNLEIQGLPGLISALNEWWQDGQAPEITFNSNQSPKGLLENLSSLLNSRRDFSEGVDTADLRETGLDSIRFTSNDPNLLNEEIQIEDPVLNPEENFNDLEGGLQMDVDQLLPDFSEVFDEPNFSFDTTELDKHSAALMAKYFPKDLISDGFQETPIQDPIRKYGQCTYGYQEEGFNKSPSRAKMVPASEQRDGIEKSVFSGFLSKNKSNTGESVSSEKPPIAKGASKINKSDQNTNRDIPRDLMRLGRTNIKPNQLKRSQVAHTEKDQRKPKNVGDLTKYRIEKLKIDLKKEQMLLARLVKSNLQLKDGGAKVVGRISNLRQQIAGLEKALPKEKQHTADSSSKVSKMIPIQNLNHQGPDTKRSVKNATDLASGTLRRGTMGIQFTNAEVKKTAVKKERHGVSPQIKIGNRPEEVLKKEKEKQKEREIERQKEIQERLKLKRKQEAEVWEKRRRLLDNKALSQQVVGYNIGEEEEDGVWSCMSISGTEHAQCSVSKLCNLLVSGEIGNSTMVHDEEAGISMKLETLLRQPLNRAKLVSAEIKQKWKAKQNMPLEGTRNDQAGRKGYNYSQPLVSNPEKQELESGFTFNEGKNLGMPSEFIRDDVGKQGENPIVTDSIEDFEKNELSSPPPPPPDSPPPENTPSSESMENSSWRPPDSSEHRKFEVLKDKNDRPILYYGGSAGTQKGQMSITQNSPGINNIGMQSETQVNSGYDSGNFDSGKFDQSTPTNIHAHQAQIPESDYNPRENREYSQAFSQNLSNPFPGQSQEYQMSHQIGETMGSMPRQNFGHEGLPARNNQQTSPGLQNFTEVPLPLNNNAGRNLQGMSQEHDFQNENQYLGEMAGVNGRCRSENNQNSHFEIPGVSGTDPHIARQKFSGNEGQVSQRHNGLLLRDDFKTTMPEIKPNQVQEPVLEGNITFDSLQQILASVNRDPHLPQKFSPLQEKSSFQLSIRDQTAPINFQGQRFHPHAWSPELQKNEPISQNQHEPPNQGRFPNSNFTARQENFSHQIFGTSGFHHTPQEVFREANSHQQDYRNQGSHFIQGHPLATTQFSGPTFPQYEPGQRFSHRPNLELQRNQSETDRYPMGGFQSPYRQG